ncbi:phosphatase PAP2 family protein [Microbispora sp. NPDC049125]|uniref:phosphatase PAP2 family protein n=1 Tax=Microbispora sp. NPDC049125 TaxID=3154929 RepID=UPI0034650C0C
MSPPPDLRNWRREIATAGFSRLIERARPGVRAGGGRGQPTVLVEVIVLALAFLLFTRLHAAVAKDFASATANALALQSLERGLNMDIERTANEWLTEHPALIQPSVYYYRLYYVVLAGVLLWVLFRHADVYTKVRRTLLAMIALVLPVYWALPMSPPRFALPGVVDIIAEHDILGSHSAAGAQNYTAMPSMHVGWSAWCAYAVWSALRACHPRAALLAWVFPLGMVADVLITGNHYVLDIVGSAVLLGVSIAAASVWGRLADRRREGPPSANQVR